MMAQKKPYARRRRLALPISNYGTMPGLLYNPLSSRYNTKPNEGCLLTARTTIHRRHSAHLISQY
jgi:hypothetical protein